ncbi:tetratricopeptide repeat protein [Akkermansiaceae bacterium]|nr:tetratricopeptide repeat protein [Akkermansiaceae bacterium]
MFKGYAPTQAPNVWAAVLWISGLLLAGSMAQAPENPQFDPSDVYFQAYLEARAGEQLEKDGDFMAALKKYEQAGKLFDSVGRFYPDWKSGMVQNRRELTAKAVEVVRGKAGEQIRERQGVIAELEGGAKVGAAPNGNPIPEVQVAGKQPRPREGGLAANPVEALQDRRLRDAEAEAARLRKMIAEADARSTEAMRNATRVDDLKKQNELLAQKLREADSKVEQMRQDAAAQRRQEELNRGVLEVDPLLARRLKDAEAEMERLRKMIAEGNASSNAAMRNATRVDDLNKQNDLLARKLKAAEADARSLRAEMAAAPVKSEMDALNNQIERLEQEREAMGMALRTSRGDHTEALSKIAILNADMDILKKQATELRQAQANMQRDLEKERKVANDVVAGQRRQMEALEKALEEKSSELENARGEIAALHEQLEESREAFAALRDERDGLLQERDQMAALLKQDDAGRTVQLIEQNMGLVKLLREANEKVERLNRDNNAAKDDVVDALRDLAIAKSQINRLHQDKREQDKRISDLMAKLRNEETALASGQVDADPVEVEMLREVIRRQLRVQERRRQAKELLVEAAKDLGKQDGKINEAVDLLDGAELVLTPEEQRLVADQQVDGEFISPFARDRATVNRATGELNRELESYDRAATKAYLAGRLLPTRELFELMVEQHPGHVPALCKLGVVQMKLEQPIEAAESFQKAIELDGNNSYANRMLGYAMMKTGDLPSAQQHLRRAVDLAPDDAKAYLLLGTVSFRLGDTKDAESNFKAAISADPVPSEPYFNLAVIHAKAGNGKEGLDCYNKALERGAVPDQALFEKLGGKP